MTDTEQETKRPADVLCGCWCGCDRIVIDICRCRHCYEFCDPVADDYVADLIGVDPAIGQDKQAEQVIPLLPRRYNL